MTKVVNFLGNRKSIAFFLVASILFVVWCIPLERVLKRDREIEGILEKEYPLNFCVQYALIATADGYFP